MSTKRLEVSNADDFDEKCFNLNNSIRFELHFIGSENDSIRCKSFADFKSNQLTFEHFL